MDNIEELEKLKKKTNASSENSTMGDFVSKTLKSIRNIVVYFVLGGLILYVCKLNKLVVIPTDIDKQPFTIPLVGGGGFMDKIKNMASSTFAKTGATEKTNTNSEKGFMPEQKTSEVFSTIFDKFQTIRFNVEQKPYTLLKFFAEYKNSPKSNFFANFIIAQLESLLSTNYSMFSGLFTFMDETFNDTMIVLLGPVITILCSMLIVLFDYFYIIYGWFSNLHWLFKRNKTNNTKSGGPNWVTPIFSIDLFVSWNLAMVLNILFLFSLPVMFTIPVLQMTIVALTLISLISFKGMVNEEPVNAVEFLYKHFIKNYKRLISVVLTLSVLINSFNILGPSHGVFGLIFVFLIYFTTNLYKPFVFNEQTASGDPSAPPLDIPFAESVYVAKGQPVDEPFVPPVFTPSAPAAQVAPVTDMKQKPVTMQNLNTPMKPNYGDQQQVTTQKPILNTPKPLASSDDKTDEPMKYFQNPFARRKNVQQTQQTGGGLLKELKSINKKYNLK